MKLDRKQASNLHVHWGTPTAGVSDNKLDKVGGDRLHRWYGEVGAKFLEPKDCGPKPWRP